MIEHTRREDHTVKVSDVALCEALRKAGVALPEVMQEFRIDRQGGYTFLTWSTKREAVPGVAIHVPDQDMRDSTIAP